LELTWYLYVRITVFGHLMAY